MKINFISDNNRITTIIFTCYGKTHYIKVKNFKDGAKLYNIYSKNGKLIKNDLPKYILKEINNISLSGIYY